MATLNEQLTELQTARDNMKTALTEKGQAVTNDIRTYAEAIAGISGGSESSGDVKLFTSVEEMHADESAVYGDKAVVYGTKRQPYDGSVPSASFYFPDTVTLPNAVTSTYTTNLSNENRTFAARHTLSLTSSMMYMRSMSASSYAVRYSSSDGLIYTRDADYDDTYVYEEPLVLYSSTWNEIFTPFIYADEPVFYGLYEYYENGRKDVIRAINLNDITVDVANKVITWNGNYNNTLIPHAVLIKAFNEVILPEYPTAKTTDCGVFINQDDELYICVWINENGSLRTSFDITAAVDANNKLLGMTLHDYLKSQDIKLKTWKIHDDGTYGTLETLSRNESGYIPYIPKTMPFRLTDMGWYLNIRYYSVPISNMTYVNGSQTDLGYNLTPDGYYSVPTQFTLKNANQLLSGLVALGKNGVVTGDDSVYDNLDWEPLLVKKFNLTKTADKATNTSSNCYSILPTKYVSSVTNEKQTFLKRNSMTDATIDYLGIVKRNEVRYIPLQEGHTLHHSVYHAKSNTLTSIQYDSSGQYTLYIQNYDTQEILYSENINGECNLYLAGNNVVRYEYTAGSSSKSGTIFIYRYDLTTYQKTSILTFTTTNQATGFQFVNTDNRYIIFMYAYASSYDTASTCYRYIKVFDGETNTTTNVINGTTMSSTKYSPSLRMYVCSCDDVIYIYSDITRSGYFAYNLHSYNKTTKSVSSVTSGSSVSNLPSASTTKNGYADSTYIYFGNTMVPKSSVSKCYDIRAILCDTQGNQIDKYKLTDPTTYVYSINGTAHVYSSNCNILARVQSYTIEDDTNTEVKIMRCKCDKFYPIKSSLYNHYLIPNETAATRATCDLDFGTLQEIGEDTYSATFKLNYIEKNRYPTSMDILFYPCDESTSLDYDFSAVYTGSDTFAQINPDYLCISKDEYDTAIDTASEILGEEVIE